jgi:acyl-CoA synthetase (AMP-forming)/AMP-acid ligase II
MIFGDVIERNARCFGDHPAVLFEGRTLTHRTFATRVTRLVNALAAKGFVRGDRIAILSRNCPEYLEVYGAAGLAGFAALGLNYRLSAVEQAGILADADPAVLMFEMEYIGRVEELRTSLPSSVLFVCFDAPAKALGWAIDYETLVASAQDAPLAFRAGEDDTMLLIYTSGTTGVAKGVMLGNEGQTEQARVQALALAAQQTDVKQIVMPFYHIGGPTMLFSSLIVGGTIVLHRTFDAAAVLQAIAEHKVTVAHYAPTMIAMLLDLQEQTPVDVSSLHTICYASAPMSVALSLRARKVFGPIFMQIYGMTEAGLGSALLKHQHILDGTAVERGRLASAGQPYLGTEMKIVNDDGTECKTGQIGEVCMRSKSVMKGYWRKPEVSALALSGGFLHTGDMGYLDEDNFLFIVDRKKDMIISGGENIYCREVEEALLLHPAVAEVAVIGKPDPKWGESVVAVLVLKPGSRTDDAALMTQLTAHCRSHIAGYKCPKVYQFVDTMPRVQSTNKVDKRALRAPFWAGHARQVS